MKVIKGKDAVGLLDEENRKITIRNREIHLEPNMIVGSGDSLNIGGDLYDVLDYNPSWFAEVAKRGPQVIHSKDASYMIGRAGIKCGDRVLEAGVGSGAMSSTLLWTIGHEGKLYSVENEASSRKTAHDNVSMLQETGNWEIIQGDVRTSKLPENLDCAILDIPDPWNALENIMRCVRTGGSIVTYSPTYNQTDLTVDKMQALGLSVVETVELIRRNILVRPEATRPDHRMIGHTAFLTFSVKKSGHTLKI